MSHWVSLTRRKIAAAAFLFYYHVIAALTEPQLVLSKTESEIGSKTRTKWSGDQDQH